MLFLPLIIVRSPEVNRKIKALDIHNRGMANHIHEKINEIAASDTKLRENIITIGDYTISYQIRYKYIIFRRELIIENIHVEGFEF